VGAQEVGWNRSGTGPTGDYKYLNGNGNENRELTTGLFLHKRIISSDKRTEFVRDRMSHVYNTKRSLV
jgi:hypothetical protein